MSGVTCTSCGVVVRLLRTSSAFARSNRPKPFLNTVTTTLTQRGPHYHLHLPTSLQLSSPQAMEAASASSRVSAVSNGGGGLTRFPLSPSNDLVIQKGDITQWFVNGATDAIVNPANELMLGGGGADGAIHRAAGPDLLQACYNVPEVRPGVRCPTGEARITLNSLSVAKDNNIQYIAFPAISCGVYGYPYDEAATIAISTVKHFANDFKEVHFVLFSPDICNVWLNKASELLKH
ncbi:macro domain-containing protein XCC3184 isoform X3 [Carya illinoinensis]|uniref:macro domain-containing protein XCC3184 isoform X3 n=1 Tax=Carya illinoinensis TaxID=32201 RepID=UPI001C71F34C|nr:macro domain-containing protein XCC3184 isoform X3 [Carya illinoinensis]